MLIAIQTLTLSLLVAAAHGELERRPATSDHHASSRQKIAPRSSMDLVNDQLPIVYTEEQADGFRPAIIEASASMRLANVQHATTSSCMLNVDAYEVNQLSALKNWQVRNHSAGSPVDQARCGRDLGRMLELMHELESMGARGQHTKHTRSAAGSPPQLQERHLRLLHALDSFGRYSSGALLGKSLFRGNQAECDGTHLLLEAPSARLSPMRTCYARWSLADHLNVSTELSTAIQLNHLYPKAQLVSAICVPRTCHMTSFQEHAALFQDLASSQFKLPKEMYGDEARLEMVDLFCTPDPDSRLLSERKPVLWVLGATLLGWLLLIGHATSRHASAPAEKPANRGGAQWRAKLYGALSLQENWLAFVGKPRRVDKMGASCARGVNLDAFSPFKVAFAALIVQFHVFLIMAAISAEQKNLQYNMDRSTLLMVEFFCEPLVYVYFIMTAILVSYLNLVSIHQELRRTGPPPAARWLLYGRISMRIFFKRYVRLVPLLFIIHSIKRILLMNSLTASPFDASLNEVGSYGLCISGGWASPLLMHASWSVSVDLVCCLIVAPIVTLLLVRPLLGCSILVALSVASNLASYTDLIELDPAVRASAFDMRFSSFATFIHRSPQLITSPFHRSISFFIGTLAGYILFRHQLKFRQQLQEAVSNGQTGMDGKRSPRIGNPFGEARLNWLLERASSVSLLGVVLFYLYLPWARALNHRTIKLGLHRTIAEMFLTSFSGVFNLICAFILLRMVTDWSRAPVAKMFTRSRFLNSMAKLNYAILLLHFDVCSTFMTPLFRDLPFSGRLLFVVQLATYVITVLLSIPMHVLIESPLDRLAKAFLWARDTDEATPRAKQAVD